MLMGAVCEDVVVGVTSGRGRWKEECRRHGHGHGQLYLTWMNGDASVVETTSRSMRVSETRTVSLR